MKFIFMAIAMLSLMPHTRAQNHAQDTVTNNAPDSSMHAGELDEVRITTTRSNRSIRDIPTRVEFINGEELDEKANMKPGDIRMMLSESTGIQTQQTSATSANASIRIQGLDGRYTQILKDGFPLYSGAASGLGLLQTPPLDLKQVEIIKGSASTLYGGGAIAGLINLISKTPTTERELRLQANATSAKGLDLNGFYGQRFGKVGVTLFAARNTNDAFDPSDIGLSAIPKFERYTINPKLFFYLSEKTTITAGINTIWENRMGGDMRCLNGEGDSSHSYFEKNTTNRFSAQLSVAHQVDDASSVSFKNSYSYFNRTISTPGYLFKGAQKTTYSELNYHRSHEKTEWIAGANLLTDAFSEQSPGVSQKRNYAQTTLGGFVQNTYNLSGKFILETGLRGDYVFDYGFSLLPRISVLYKHGSHFSSRLGGGLGYKAPTLFTEESERIQYRNVLPISPATNQLERSYGLNWDGNYRTAFFKGKLSFSINQLFFYTAITHPLLMQAVGGDYRFENSIGHIDSKGAETNIKLGFHDLKLFLGYTLTDAYLHEGAAKTDAPLTSKHKVNMVLMYERDEKWKIGLEAYYYSRQLLNDGKTGRDYWLCGFMAERSWRKFSLYINLENMLDVRQTRFDSIYTGTITNPQFRDIYAPLDGFVANGGLKIRL